MKSNGFTLIELMVAIGILLILLALSTINISRLPSSASQVSTFDGLITDLRAQQTLAMSGYNNASYGITFSANSYSFFPNTFTVNLDPTVELIDTYTNHTITFTPGSGDVVGWNSTDSITVKNTTTGDTKVIKLNKYGATY